MLQNRSFVQARLSGFSPRCSSPLSLINSEPPGGARSSPGRGARRSRSLDGEDRAVQFRSQGKGAWPALRRRKPPSIRALDSFILFLQASRSYYLS